MLLDDGAVRLRVREVDATDVHTVVEIGGVLSNNKGINLPGVDVSVPAMSEKDVDDLRWALSMPVDMIALSFVRRASDVDDVRKVMNEVGVLLPLIAKIEKPQAVENLDGDRRGLRRLHGGPWRPRGGAAARGGPAGAEADHRHGRAATPSR